ncbi:MAG: hypothetical protein QOF04_2297, partial [Solirubrobacteraceae bacterium]|nr:hypothetical protein [Solirubrobacteraceae bacterium]
VHRDSGIIARAGASCRANASSRGSVARWETVAGMRDGRCPVEGPVVGDGPDARHQRTSRGRAVLRRRPAQPLYELYDEQAFVAGEPAEQRPEPDQQATGSAPPASRRPAARLAAVGALLAALVVAGGVVRTGHRSSSPSTGTATPATAARSPTVPRTGGLTTARPRRPRAAQSRGRRRPAAASSARRPARRAARTAAGPRRASSAAIGRTPARSPSQAPRPARRAAFGPPPAAPPAPPGRSSPASEDAVAAEFGFER